MRTLNCKEATQSIKKLYEHIGDKQSNEIAVKKAFKIYAQIGELVKNHFVINTMVKLCIKTRHPHKLWLIWNDIFCLLGSSNVCYPSLLRCCIESNEFEKGTIIHSKIPIAHIQNDDYIQTALINFYGHFGQMTAAKNIFEIVSDKVSVHGISALMKAQIKNKNENEALAIYQRYKNKVQMNDFCHLFAIKSAQNTKNYQIGQEIVKNVKIKNASIELANCIISFYGDFGQRECAQSIFDQIDNRSVVTINSMMQCQINCDFYADALSIFYDVRFKYLRDDVSCLLALKACTHSNERELGELIINQNLHKTKNVKFVCAAIHFYAHFGLVSSAENVFRSNENKLCIQMVNALMSAYFDNAKYKESISLFQKYEKKIGADKFSYILALKCYAQRNELDKAKELFSEIDNMQIEIVNTLLGIFSENECFGDAFALYKKYENMHDDVSQIVMLKTCIAANNFKMGQFVANNIRKKSIQNKEYTLIAFYGHFGDIESAKKIFFETKTKNNVIINKMMAAFIQNEQYQNALNLFLKSEEFVDDISILLAIKSCINVNDESTANQIIEKFIQNRNDILHDTQLQNTLIHFYGHFGHLDVAQNVFEQIENKSIQSFNSMMTAFIDNDQNENALTMYENILTPTVVSHLIAIKAHGNMKNMENARKIFYANEHSKECVNCLMSAYVNNGMYEEALSFYDENKDKKNDVFTLLALKCCAKINDTDKGREIIENIENVQSASMKLKCSLVDYYGNTANMNAAQRIFDDLNERERDVVAINCLMTAMQENGQNAQCIDLWQKYEKKIKNDIVANVVLIKACTQSSSLHFGQEIHERLKENGLIKDKSIQINLIHFYAKCGMLSMCEEIFSNIANCKDTEVWNAIISAFGRNGDFEKVTDFYQRMQHENVPMNEQIFTSYLNACSHAGNVNEARIFLQGLNEEKIAKNTMNAFVDCFARNGHLEEAKNVILSSEYANVYSLWMSLLNGCRKYKNVQIAESVFDEMKVRCEANKEKMGAAAVLLSHIYAAYDDHDKVDKIRSEMKANGWTKMKGISEIDVCGRLHRFEAGNKYKMQMGEECARKIDEKLNDLAVRLKENGFVHDFSFITKRLDSDKEREYELMRHSEKIALSYALIKSDKMHQIVINNNLRTCNDCHNAFKLISKIEQRKIVLSDANRVHIFENGSCSCKDCY